MPPCPPELIHIIATSAATSALSALCRVSHATRFEAERVLYRAIDLTECTRRVLRAWCKVMKRRVHLPSLVGKLSIRLLRDLETEDGVNLARILTLCVNLKDLSILHPTRRFPTAGIESRQNSSWESVCYWSWLIAAAPFRLDRFHCTGLQLDFLNEKATPSRPDVDFWKNQTALRILSIPDQWQFPIDTDTLSEQPAYLATLEVLETTATAFNLGYILPALRTLHLHVSDSHLEEDLLHAFSHVAIHDLTLERLVIIDHGLGSPSRRRASYIPLVAGLIPTLRHLAITHAPCGTPGTHVAEAQQMLRNLHQLVHLESLVLQFQRPAGPLTMIVADNFDMYALNKPAQARKFGNSVMQRLLPPLARLEVGVAVGTRTPVSYVFTRDSDTGKVVSRTVDGWEWDAAREFMEY
ncbi:hypothetical protein MIND_00568800 [Mycena indigotica]|uniref:Uncharacterized protein n=1 Tax=Mycena indigotica TaxID=2126181 RepID=A0A8H6W2Q0_9AGAR|nr:uncharacterized protein MIND_00568800 [Mycena indigotica]KAF7303404.1 hypothetical protein MIND_00568800 [Mycena indigotica]